MIKGSRMSEESKSRVSSVKKGRPSGREGKHLSDETRAKMSAIRRGKPLSEATKTKMRQKRLTDEHKAKIGVAPHIHHYDFDHSNDLPENRRVLSRKQHGRIHNQSGRRGVIFVRDALEKGIVTRDFYNDYLAYLNQEGLGQ